MTDQQETDRQRFSRFRRTRPDQKVTGVPVRQWERRVVICVAVASALCIAGVGGSISYSHMFDWATANGEIDAHRWRAQLFPVSVDGAILMATTVIYADARMERARDKLAYAVALSGMVWSIGANVGHDWISPLAAKLIAGWPPIALAVSVELLVRFVKRIREQSDEDTRRAEKAAARAVKPAWTAPVAPKPEPAPVTEPDEITREAATLTPEMEAAGWAPDDYTNAGAAMLGYLEKVNPDTIGADLDRLIGTPFFKVKPGRGRQIVQNFKAAQAAASSTLGKE